MSEDSPIPSPSPDTPPPALSDVGTPVDSSAISPSSPGSPHPVASVGPTEEAEAHNAAHDAKDANAPSLGIGTIVRHPSFGVGRIFSYEGNSYVILFRGEAKKISFDFQGMKVEEPEGDPEMDRVREAVRDVLAEYGWVDIGMEMSSRFQGGAMILEPGKPGTQAKEIPLETFFKKIIGVREKLRVLEQKINNHKSLSEEEKLELEGYITRCYGSLTTFNVLFADKEIYFRGTGKGVDAHMKDRKHPKLELATVLPPLGVFLFAACLMMMAVVSTGCGGDDSGGGTNDTSMVEVMEPETETTNDMTQADMPEAAPEPAPAPSPVPLPPIPGNVLALGDSITEGFGQESWVTKLSRLKPLNFINAGVRGNRASQAADRLPGLIERHRPETVLILLGTNDALGRNVQSALTGIQDATQIARSAGASVVIGTIPPILLRGSETPEPEPEPETETEPDPDPEPTPDPDPTPDPTPDPADPDPELSPTDPDPNADPDKIDPPEDMTAARDPDPRNAIVQEINDAIRAFAEANGIPVADPNSLIGDGIGLMLEDGFHPTDMGQELIAIAFNSAF